jgi:hypothetical protein
MVCSAEYEILFWLLSVCSFLSQSVRISKVESVISRESVLCDHLGQLVCK